MVLQRKPPSPDRLNIGTTISADVIEQRLKKVWNERAAANVAKPLILLVPGERIELPTNGLQNRCSTAELTRLINDLAFSRYQLGTNFCSPMIHAELIAFGRPTATPVFVQLSSSTWRRAFAIAFSRLLKSSITTQPPSFASKPRSFELRFTVHRLLSRLTSGQLISQLL